MSGNAQRSINLTDPILVHTEVLEEEDQTEATEELTEAQLDPIQKLFLDKIREYSTESQASGGPVDAGPEYEKAFSEELNKLQRLYGSGDLTEFPEFKFSGGYIYIYIFAFALFELPHFCCAFRMIMKVQINFFFSPFFQSLNWMKAAQTENCLCSV
uniref:ATP synthase peripheral stalk subunit F6, mitochondrial n=1 Tax=Sinocyclocheilus grahami TaxID=75366 RepID=A0A672PKK8_SINGR